MKSKKRFRQRLIFNYILSFITFFLLAGTATTVSFLLFFHSYDLPVEYVEKASQFTFYNLLFISAAFALIGTAWKKYTVEKPIEEINKVLIRIKKGDFSAHLNRKIYTQRFSTIVNNVNLMTRELQSFDKMKISMMSNISHELKTPVSVISNYATLLQDTDLPPEKQVEYAKAISDSSRKMTELITNILKINQLENQKIPTDMRENDLGEQICECLLNFEDVWEKKNIEIDTDIEDSILVTSDMKLLDIVWNNLFSNALKFTPEGGRLTVSLKGHKKYAVVKITDTGCGISKENLETIFEKFYQCDTSRATDGNGLGLALVKRIINITGCFINVESEVGEGTTFTVKVPRS